MALSKATIRSIATDGTNLYVEVEVFTGDVTEPLIRATFPAVTTAAAISSYVQTIANNRPSLTADIAALVNTSVTGV